MPRANDEVQSVVITNALPRGRLSPSVTGFTSGVVFPKIRAALMRIEELEELDPLACQLRDSSSVQRAWNRMSLVERRHIIRLLVLPRINPVPPEERGQPGINARRVDLV
ncbi:hypothetical protein AOT96_29005 [Rhodococcus sp. 008]|nr:hypothetical protein AOT96_29005 [Rhodococcus sp. 008]